MRGNVYRTELPPFGWQRGVFLLWFCLGIACNAPNTFASSTPPFQQGSQKPAVTETNTEPSDTAPYKSTVGFPKLIYQHVIAGPKVIAKPISDRNQAMIVRLVETYPHGSNFRYDIQYKSLEPGRYNVADYLEREDGSTQPISPIFVEVSSLLGPGQILPYELPPKSSGYQSFYLRALLIGGVAWFAGLLMILFYGREKTKRLQKEAAPLTVADRLRPLLDSAINGELTSREQAELERVLSSFWSNKLRLSHLPADQLRDHLRGHPEASVLLNQIDSWLHKPKSDIAHPININDILKPYQTMNYDDVN